MRDSPFQTNGSELVNYNRLKMKIHDGKMRQADIMVIGNNDLLDSTVTDPKTVTASQFDDCIF